MEEKDGADTPEPKPNLELEKCRERIKALEDLHLRARADLENYRRRVEREREEVEALACASILQGLLPILDHFEKGLKAVQDSAQGGIGDGFALILEQLKRLVASRGVEAVGVAGEVFDPHSMEAIASVPSGTIGENQVVEVVRAGHRWRNRLLRPALVVVSKGPPTDGSGDAPGETES
jgi:molecular chaperone GrpE